MKAAVLHQLPASSLSFEDVEPPALGDRELLVRIRACGICGTDLHILAGESYRPILPFVLGHEPVGEVVDGGRDADRSWLGRRISLSLFRGCGVCRWCVAGDERLCPDLESVRGVLNAWGGFAELMTVPGEQAVSVPAGLGTVEAAALVDAGATAVNAAEVAAATGSTEAVVIGGGPVGFLTAEALRCHGIASCVVEPQEARRKAAGDAGHRTAVELAEPAGDTTLVVECSAAPAAVAWALDALRPHGTLLLVGYGVAPLLDLAPAARKELTIRGIRSGARSHLARAFDLAAAGEIRLPPIQIWPIAAINDAFEALRTGAVAGKAVIEIADQEKERAWTS